MTTRDGRSRRQFVATVGAAGIAAIAGCGDQSEEPVRFERPLELGDLSRSGDWTTDGGDVRNSGTVSSTPEPPLEVDWRYEVGGILARPAPRIADDLVLGSDSDDRVVAIDVETGEERWRVEGRSPIVVGDGIALFNRDGAVRAVDLETGDERWETTLESGKMPWVRSTDGAQVIVDDRIRTAALDAQTGEERWRLETGYETNAVAIDGETAFLASGDTYVYALDAFDGTRSWRYKTDGDPTELVAADGRVHVAIEPRLSGDRTTLRTLAAADGTVNWSCRLDGDPSGLAARAGGVVCDADELHAFEAADGRACWRTTEASTVGSMLAVGPDRLYARGTTRAELRAIDVRTGDSLWSDTVPGQSIANLAITPDAVYVGDLLDGEVGITRLVSA